MVPEIIIDEKFGQKRENTKRMSGDHEKIYRADCTHPKRNSSEEEFPASRTDGRPRSRPVKMSFENNNTSWLRRVAKNMQFNQNQNPAYKFRLLKFRPR